MLIYKELYYTWSFIIAFNRSLYLQLTYLIPLNSTSFKFLFIMLRPYSFLFFSSPNTTTDLIHSIFHSSHLYRFIVLIMGLSF